MFNLKQMSSHTIHSILMGVSLVVLSSALSSAMEVKDSQSAIQASSEQLSSDETKARKAYNRGMKQLSKNPVSAIKSFEFAASKGHIPSKIELIKNYIEGLKEEIKVIEDQKVALSVELHQNEVFIETSSLMEFDKKLSGLYDTLEDPYLDLQTWEDILKDIKNKKLVPFKRNAAYLPWSENQDYAFFDDSEDEIAEEKPEPVKHKINAQEYLERELKNVDDFFNWRLKANTSIIKKLMDLSNNLLSPSFKATAREILKCVEKKIKSNEQEINNHRLFLFNDNTSKESICEKINFCLFTLRKNSYKISSLIRSSMSQYFLPENFMYLDQQNDLNKTFEILYKVFKLDDFEDMNSIKFWVSEQFLASHDQVCRRSNISPQEKLVKLRLTLGMANNQMQLIDHNHFDADEDFCYKTICYQENIDSILGKYVSWFLNQKHPLYNGLLFVGTRINHELLNFYRFSQKIKGEIDENPGVDIIRVLQDLNEFQLPIYQMKQLIFVHSTEPYVVRVKGGGLYQYTIGLIKSSYDISQDSKWFSTITLSSDGVSFGTAYKLTNGSNGYPTIFDPANEILKFSYICSPSLPLSTLTGVTIPANKNHVLGWKVNVSNNARDNLMDNAHLTYTN